MKKIMTVDGNEACSNTAYMFTELAGIYPITPSSPMAEHLDEWSCNNRLNIYNDKVKVVEMQSEAGASGFIHGALQAGTLATTFTSSQGLLLMIPNMYKIAGEMLPLVMHVAARSLSTHALSILGDHQDIYATRSTGFCMLASSNVQDCSYLSAIAHLSAIEASLPFMHFFDGFRTSHEIDKIEALELSDYKKLLNKDALKKFRNRALNINKPVTRGLAFNDDIYFQSTEARNIFYYKVPDIVNSYMEKLNELAGTDYKPFNYYGSNHAKKVIIAMGSVCDTIKETIDNLDEDLGLVEVHLYRPFSSKYLKSILPNSVDRIAVLDRTKEFGSNGEPLYLDVVATLKDSNIKVVGGRYGLSSKNTTPSQIKAVFEMLDNPINNFTIGIKDDVTNLSLDDREFHIKKSKEILIYGYGSDGMISASKSIIKLIGENTDNYVQGYFQYDSKKSGGVTVSHLRFSENKIRSTYYIESPDVLVVSKDSYLNSFKLINKIEDNSIFLINTNKSREDLIDRMPNDLKHILYESKTKIYMIDAYSIAQKFGLGNKISMIMEAAILYLTNILNYDLAKDELKEFIENKFSKKGKEIIEANINSLDMVEKSILSFTLNEDFKVNIEKYSNAYEAILKRAGNSLPTSSFLPMIDGTFMPNTTSLDKNKISELVPKWISQNCIQCNQCSFVCPHSVIRPFLLSEEEYKLSPTMIKERCVKAIGLENYYYIISAAIDKCTGCGLCINTCPGMRGNKALNFNSIKEEEKNKEQEVFDYLEKNIKDKGLIKKETIKGSQFVEPNFKYCGACAGCGEPAYIKVLTQLFKDNLVIANATGCSSIYGGSAPLTPYNLPWASSLFEDNAEYGFGIMMGSNFIRNKIKNIMENNLVNENKELFKKWLDNYDNYEITKEVSEKLTDNIPKELKELKDYIPSRNIWCVGGDGWAYDIGFSGIDHVLSSNQNINILVLDSEVYSNTGGQMSKASPVGSIASFASSGKKTAKKDLARIAMNYPNVYVAQVSLGYNGMQLIKALTEANNHKGPSIVIAYCPCISHGIKGGMSQSIEMEKLAVQCGYFPIFRFKPNEGLIMDSKKVDFTLYDEFLNRQTRYSMLKEVNKKEYEELLKSNLENAKKRYKEYCNLEKVD